MVPMFACYSCFPRFHVYELHFALNMTDDQIKYHTDSPCPGERGASQTSAGGSGVGVGSWSLSNLSWGWNLILSWSFSTLDRFAWKEAGSPRDPSVYRQMPVKILPLRIWSVKRFLNRANFSHSALNPRGREPHPENPTSTRSTINSHGREPHPENPKTSRFCTTEAGYGTTSHLKKTPQEMFL